MAHSLPHRLTPPTRALLARVCAPPTLALAILALAAATRLPWLGLKPFMHDESLFAYFGYTLWTSGALDYDPMLHGPLLLQVSAALFALLGDSDVTARLFCALCGVGIVAALLWLRPLPGRAANSLAALFATASPALCYYSRFCRNDVPFALFTILWVAGCAGYWRTRRPGWGVLAVLSFAAAACVKETIVFLIAASVGFGVLLIGVDLARSFRQRASLVASRGRSEASGRSSVALFVIINNVVLAALFVAYVFARRIEVVDAAAPLVVFMSIAAVSAVVSWVVTAAVRAVRDGWGAEALAARMGGVLWRDRYVLGAAAVAGLVLFLLVYNSWQIGRFSPVGLAVQCARRLVGAQDEPIQWLKPAWSVHTSGTLGFFDIIGRAVGYWWGQHAEHRLRGPFHYYAPILIVYEWPLLVIAVVGAGVGLLRTGRRVIATACVLTAAGGAAWAMSRLVSVQWLDRYLHIQSYPHLALAWLFGAAALALTVMELAAGRRARAFVVFWFATMALALSYAGEKVPWLAVHLALPLALLAGDLCVSGARRWGRAWASGAAERRTLAGLALIPVAAFALAATLKCPGDLARLLTRGHDPAEQLIYNHTTVETKRCAETVLELRAFRLARGKSFSLAVAGEAAWPMNWYLRDIEFAPTDPDGGLTTPTQDVILCDPKERERWPELELDYEIHPLALRSAWVPPTVSFGRRLMAGADRETWPAHDSEDHWPVDRRRWDEETRWLWRYWLRRELFPADEDSPDPTLDEEFLYCLRKHDR
jgi:predicted membrane-bound mannosyltransferase